MFSYFSLVYFAYLDRFCCFCWMFVFRSLPLHLRVFRHIWRSLGLSLEVYKVITSLAWKWRKDALIGIRSDVEELSQAIKGEKRNRWELGQVLGQVLDRVLTANDNSGRVLGRVLSRVMETYENSVKYSTEYLTE